MSEIQAVRRKERPTMDDLIIVNTIIENERVQKQNTYMFFEMLLNASINFGLSIRNA